MGGGSAAALGLGLGGNGPTAKLSRERKHRMRELATQKLSRAYHLDEIASSVATMQGASSLEEVAKLVLQRKPNDSDAKYVHFFHEKIPSRMLAQSTGLQTLDEIIREKPAEGEPLRTRAVTRIFKDDYHSAAHDLTEALSLCRYNMAQHIAGQGQLELANTLGGAERRNGGPRDRRRGSNIQEKDQPSSLEAQLLFHRAGAYLTLACQSVHAALQQPPPQAQNATPDSYNEQTDNELLKRQQDARKSVRADAKRALRDYVSFVSHFEYTPGLAAEATEDYFQKVNAISSNLSKTMDNSPARRLLDIPQSSNLGNGNLSNAAIQYHQPSPAHNRDPGLSYATAYPSLPLPEIYRTSALFSSSIPPNLPPYPATRKALMTCKTTSQQRDHDEVSGRYYSSGEQREAVTYHPLLTDALHSLLLCHSLMQTPPKELLRHAHMVARLARICDGYPIFLAARSPSRADWIEVIQLADNWLGLQQSWESLCAPAPLPGQNELSENAGSDEHVDELCRQEAIIEALANERVHDGASFQAAIHAHERRAEGLRRETVSSKGNSPKRWAQEDGKGYPVGSKRAEVIARWVTEAPPLSSDSNKTKRDGRSRGIKSKAGPSDEKGSSFDRLSIDA